MSYLIEVCGLKLAHIVHVGNVVMSYLIEVRGLKLGTLVNHAERKGVVPYRGAWIETRLRRWRQHGQLRRTL